MQDWKLRGLSPSVVVALFAALILPTGASAASYVLKHPNREHCKAHYVKKIEHGKTWCLTPTFISGVTISGNGGQFTVQAFLYSGTKGHEGARLLRQPVRFTITDGTTGQRLGSFTGTSFATCSLRHTYNEQATVETFVGEEIPPYQACGLAAPISISVADDRLFGVSFAGNSTYAPSSGEAL
jgi:hypothetical protein